MKTEKIEVMGQVVKAGQELVSLTDLWKAANGTDDQRPYEWLRNKNTSMFLTHCKLNTGGNRILWPTQPLRFRGSTRAIRKWGERVLQVCEENGLIQRIKGRNGEYMLIGKLLYRMLSGFRRNYIFRSMTFTGDSKKLMWL